MMGGLKLEIMLSLHTGRAPIITFPTPAAAVTVAGAITMTRYDHRYSLFFFLCLPIQN